MQKDNRILEFSLAGQDTLGLFVLGFAQDADGELYLLANSTGVPFGDSGVVLRLRDARDQRHFRAHLRGEGEEPPVETNAARAGALPRGHCRHRDAVQADRLEHRGCVRLAHSLCASGVNGPVGVTLFSGGPISPDGVLAEGVVVAPDASNACGWATLDDVVRAMRLGFTYVNVHTLDHPPGEIRGQIR